MRRLRFLAAVPVVVAAGLVGCGEDGEVEELTTALDKAVDSSSRSKFAMRNDSEKDGRFSFVGTLESEAGQERGTMRALIREPGQPPARVAMILHEAQAWYRSAALRGVLPAGKRWVRTVDPEIFSPSLSPSQFGEVLREAGSVDDLGQEEMRGTEVQHLRADVDLEHLADLVGGDVAERFQASGVEPKLRVHVWVPEGERPLKYQVDVELPRPGGGRPESASITMRVLEYDIDVDADAPPEDEVVEEDEVGL